MDNCFFCLSSTTVLKLSKTDLSKSGFKVFRSLFSKIVISRLKSVVKKSKTKIDDEVLEAFDGPLRFFPIVLGVYISTQYINLNQTLEIFSINLNRSLITIQIFLTLKFLLFL